MFVPFDPADFVGANKRRQIYNITEGLEKKKRGRNTQKMNQKMEGRAEREVHSENTCYAFIQGTDNRRA
jgi:hypothetical protein